MEARELRVNTLNSESLIAHFSFSYSGDSGWKSWQILSSLANVSLKLHDFTLLLCLYVWNALFDSIGQFYLNIAGIWHKCRVNWSKIKQKRQDFYSSFNIAIKRRTKQNAATEGVSLGILEAVSMRCAHSRLRWGWKEKKPLYVKISLWKGCILASIGRQSKT